LLFVLGADGKLDETAQDAEASMIEALVFQKEYSDYTTITWQYVPSGAFCVSTLHNSRSLCLQRTLSTGCSLMRNFLEL
jgi:hypothetical protein